MRHKLIMLDRDQVLARGNRRSLSSCLTSSRATASQPAGSTEDILHLESFTPVIQAFQHGQGDAIEALLAATRRFVHDHLST